jgi:hypothetical protein
MNRLRLCREVMDDFGSSCRCRDDSHGYTENVLPSTGPR